MKALSARTALIVAKGALAGKRVLLVSGVHGDELNPVAIIGTETICQRDAEIAVILTNSRECVGGGCPYEGDER